jgi:hypothetical protein
VVHTKGSVSVNDVVLHEGDGAFITSEQSAEIVGLGDYNEFVFFDVKRSKPHFTDAK